MANGFNIKKKNIPDCIPETTFGFNIQIINSLNECNLDGYASLGLTVNFRLTNSKAVANLKPCVVLHSDK